MKEFLVAYVFRAPMPIAVGVKVDPPLTIPFADSMVVSLADAGSADDFLEIVRKHLVASGIEPTDLKLLAVTVRLEKASNPEAPDPEKAPDA